MQTLPAGSEVVSGQLVPKTMDSGCVSSAQSCVQLTKWLCACADHTTVGFVCLPQIHNCNKLQIYTIRKIEKEEESVSLFLRDFEKGEIRLDV